MQSIKQWEKIMMLTAPIGPPNSMTTFESSFLSFILLPFLLMAKYLLAFVLFWKSLKKDLNCFYRSKKNLKKRRFSIGRSLSYINVIEFFLYFNTSGWGMEPNPEENHHIIHETQKEEPQKASYEERGLPTLLQFLFKIESRFKRKKNFQQNMFQIIDEIRQLVPKTQQSDSLFNTFQPNEKLEILITGIVPQDISLSISLDNYGCNIYLNQNRCIIHVLSFQQLNEGNSEEYRDSDYNSSGKKKRKPTQAQKLHDKKVRKHRKARSISLTIIKYVLCYLISEGCQKEKIKCDQSLHNKDPKLKASIQEYIQKGRSSIVKSPIPRMMQFFCIKLCMGLLHATLALIKTQATMPLEYFDKGKMEGQKIKEWGDYWELISGKQLNECMKIPQYPVQKSDFEKPDFLLDVVEASKPFLDQQYSKEHAISCAQSRKRMTEEIDLFFWKLANRLLEMLKRKNLNQKEQSKDLIDTKDKVKKLLTSYFTFSPILRHTQEILGFDHPLFKTDLGFRLQEFHVIMCNGLCQSYLQFGPESLLDWSKIERFEKYFKTCCQFTQYPNYHRLFKESLGYEKTLISDLTRQRQKALNQAIIIWFKRHPKTHPQESDLMQLALQQRIKILLLLRDYYELICGKYGKESLFIRKTLKRMKIVTGSQHPDLHQYIENYLGEAQKLYEKCLISQCSNWDIIKFMNNLDTMLEHYAAHQALDVIGREIEDGQFTRRQVSDLVKWASKKIQDKKSELQSEKNPSRNTAKRQYVIKSARLTNEKQERFEKQLRSELENMENQLKLVLIKSMEKQSTQQETRSETQNCLSGHFIVEDEEEESEESRQSIDEDLSSNADF